MNGVAAHWVAFDTFVKTEGGGVSSSGAANGLELLPLTSFYSPSELLAVWSSATSNTSDILYARTSRDSAGFSASALTATLLVVGRFYFGKI